MFQARVRFKLQSKQKPLATGGIAQSQRASINDALKYPGGSEHRSSLCLSKKISDKDMQKTMFNNTFDHQFTPVLVYQLLTVHSTCRGRQTESKYTAAQGES